MVCVLTCGLINGLLIQSSTGCDLSTGTFLPGATGFFDKYVLQKLGTDHGRSIEFLKTIENIDWMVAGAPRIVQATQVGSYEVSFLKC